MGSVLIEPQAFALRNDEHQDRRISRVDLIVYLMILVLGGLQFAFYLRADALADARYVELAQSILRSHTYSFDFRPETMIPPGFPLIVALVSLVAGSGTSVLFHVMALSATLALIGSYEFLRRVEGRFPAAVITLLLGSAPALFVFSTQIIFSDMPYFALSMFTLLAAWKADRAGSGHTRIAWLGLFSVLLPLSLMVRSAGITIVAGLGCWLAGSFLSGAAAGKRRLKRFLIPFLLAASVEGAWTEWAGHRQIAEWPLPGYPASYLAQLKVKDGEHPELGAARLGDIPIRVSNNVTSRAAELTKLLTDKKWINPHWSSPAVFLPLILTVFGLAISLRGGGALHDWYFVCHELMYALWPWSFEIRFLLPVVPLAVLYCWRGAKALGTLCSTRPRFAGILLTVVGSILAFDAGSWFLRERVGQALAATALWLLTVAAGCCLMAPALFQLKMKQLSNRVRTPELKWAMQMMILLGAGVVLGRGTAAEFRIGQRNLVYDSKASVFYPDMEAGQWIRSHTPPQTVVMARKQDLLYHYSGHRVEWLPPISNAGILMDGIHRYHIDLIVVNDRDDDTFRPNQQDCFQALLHSYPERFLLVHHGPDDWIFQVRHGGNEIGGQ